MKDHAASAAWSFLSVSVLFYLFRCAVNTYSKAAKIEKPAIPIIKKSATRRVFGVCMGSFCFVVSEAEGLILEINTCFGGSVSLKITVVSSRVAFARAAFALPFLGLSAFGLCFLGEAYFLGEEYLLPDDRRLTGE